MQVISRRVVGRGEETSTYSWSRFCTVNCRPTASNYQLSLLRLGREASPDLSTLPSLDPGKGRGNLYNSWSRFCTVNCQPTASNYQLSRFPTLPPLDPGKGRGNLYNSWSRFCTVNCQPLVSNCQLSHMISGQDLNSDVRGGRLVCYHCCTVVTGETREN